MSLLLQQTVASPTKVKAVLGVSKLSYGADVRLSSLERLAKAMSVSVKDLVE